MSSFTRTTKHPNDGKFYEAEWLDDYFGNHHYGIRFPDGEVFSEEDYQWITKEPTTPTLRDALRKQLDEFTVKPIPKNEHYIRGQDYIIDGIITIVVEYLEGRLPEKFRSSAMTTGETNSYGAGYNHSLDDVQAILNELMSV